MKWRGFTPPFFYALPNGAMDKPWKGAVRSIVWFDPPDCRAINADGRIGRSTLRALTEYRS